LTQASNAIGVGVPHLSHGTDRDRLTILTRSGASTTA